MNNHRQAVAEHRFFQTFDDQQIDGILECVLGEERFEEDEFLIRSGGFAHKMYLIVEGEIALEIHSPGRPPGIVQTVAGGEVLGWSWFFEPYRWSFDARAITPVTAIALSGQQLRECAEKDPDAGYLLLKEMARLLVDRLQATRLQLMDVYGSRA